MTVVTRFAPSPTGFLHIGGVRTALFNFLFARRHGGRFLLRVEDTDRRRSTPQAVKAIVDGLAWLGLEGDGETIFQSSRGARYREVTAELLERKRAYHCWCGPEELAAMRAAQKQRGEKPRYDRRCLGRKPPPAGAGVKPVVRFLNEGDFDVAFTDAVHGEIKISNRELDDLVIARSDGTPTYNFSVVVDDRDMGVTHVIRGDDHINNTPRQINLLRALGAKPPVYAHLPMILGADGARLSKRHGSVSVLEYRRHGYLPQALLNYLARLGWSHGDREIFSMPELCELFDLARVNKAAAAFDPEKLRWLNQHYIKESAPESMAPAFAACLRDAGVGEARIAQGPPLPQVIAVHRERAATLAEMAGRAKFYFTDSIAVPPNLAEKYFTADVTPALAKLAAALAATDWNAAAITEAITAAANRHNLKFGQLAQPLRVAVTGGTVSPPIDATLQLLGRERIVSRLNTVDAQPPHPVGRRR